MPHFLVIRHSILSMKVCLIAKVCYARKCGTKSSFFKPYRIHPMVNAIRCLNNQGQVIYFCFQNLSFCTLSKLSKYVADKLKDVLNIKLQVILIIQKPEKHRTFHSDCINLLHSTLQKSYQSFIIYAFYTHSSYMIYFLLRHHFAMKTSIFWH